MVAIRLSREKESALLGIMRSLLTSTRANKSSHHLIAPSVHSEKLLNLVAMSEALVRQDGFDFIEAITSALLTQRNFK